MPVSHSLFHESGTVTVNPTACTLCGACTRICPADVLHLENGRVQVCQDTGFGCIACGHCMMVCPNGCIRVTGRGISPDDLIPLPSPGERADGDALAALMRSRRSVRHFTVEEPSAELLQRIVEMASSAPMGIPPWDVGCVVIRGRDRVQSLAADVVKGYAGFLKIFKPWMLAVMRLFMRKPAYEQISSFIVPLARAYVEGRKQGRDLLFYDAPAVLLFHHSPYVDPSETMIACTYAMLAAESLGLGTTMIGAAAPIIMRQHALCRRLGIPDANKPAIALIIGTPSVHFRHGITRRFAQVSSG